MIYLKQGLLLILLFNAVALAYCALGIYRCYRTRKKSGAADKGKE